jgi:hypothetical protein
MRFTATAGVLTGDDQLPTIALFGELETVTVMGVEVVVSPTPSRARAARVWGPSDTVVESQAIEYGGVVTSAPSAAPSRRNCTPTTATGSEAVAETLTRPATVAPEAGDVIDTLGGVVFTPPLPERISMMLRLYRSVVGAVSLMVTVVPLAPTGLDSICTQ